MPRANQDLPWPPPAYQPSRNAELLSPATQIVRDREDYLGQGQRDIGRRIADDQVELFVSTDPASALQQQFERLAPQFIALHDLGTKASLHLLGALAGAAGARVQRLTIRRQGHGVALAVIQFVEVPLADGNHVRIYSTELNADTQTRQALALVLLGRSRLGVVMIGELPTHALQAMLQPLQDAITRATWPNRDLLLLPLASAGTLAAQAARMVGSSGVAVRVTPLAARPNDAWSFISGSWNRMSGHGAAQTALKTELEQALPTPPVPLPEAPTLAMDLLPADSMSSRTTTPVAPSRPVAASVAALWADYLQRCVGVKSAVCGCIFDLATQRALAHAGTTPTPDRMASQGALLLDAMASTARTLGLGAAAPQAAISFGSQHLLLHPVPGHPGIVLHLLLQGSANALTLARMQLERIAAPPSGAM
ncbi:hypothetical protein CKO44_18295 [Rubrivivax gelatinosus]|uniref:Roadblock/LAMTOR2 domain-containing protein n=1 Tax=Rubrivivax gelatinosus TaxID=28068 RepID=A0ABS1DX86_RUBGE|nr:hypothetical protein [Rubrivivax gelatinosus]MBK1615413.1 hypothetical protein [Rubrivivax gelatinosus]MBK1714113.1 hypothetical protein [Rubrivivax gelatinosus]